MSEKDKLRELAVFAADEAYLSDESEDAFTNALNSVFNAGWEARQPEVERKAAVDGFMLAVHTRTATKIAMEGADVSKATVEISMGEVYAEMFPTEGK